MSSAGVRGSNPAGLAFWEWRLATILQSLLLACCTCAFALDPSLDISQYAHTAWRVRDGFTRGEILAIAQTPDGYLWLGTEFGLLRFDGVRTVPWQPPPGAKLPSDAVDTLFAARDGTLWIGTVTGLASWKDAKLTTYPAMDGQLISSLLEDHEGTIWAGGIRGPNLAKLCAFRKTGAECHGGDGTLGITLPALYEDSKGTLWVGAKEGFWRWKPGPPTFFAVTADTDGVRGLSEDKQGALLVGVRAAGIGRLVNDRMTIEPLPAGRSLPAGKDNQPLRIGTVLRDRDGGLWIGTAEHGLIHLHDGRADAFSQADGLSGDFIRRILEDREGNIWVTTLGGLDRFRPYAVPTITSKQGLPGDAVTSVLAATDGSVWLPTFNGLSRWRQGRISIGSKPVGMLNGLAPDSIFEDSGGRIWVSTARDLGYLEDGRFVPVSGYGGGYVHGIVEGPVGHLWVANQQEGLLHIVQGKVIGRFPWTALGHPQDASALAPDPAGGGVWLGFFQQGGIAYFADGSIQKTWSPAEGLGRGQVSQLHFGPDGALWAATDGGLSRIKDGHVATLTSRNGLPCDAVHWTIEDDDHQVWLYMPCGLVRVARSELEAWAANPALTVRVSVFDAFDGVRTHPFAFGYTPQVTKSADGKLWFVAGDGVSLIDPHHLPFNKLPPPVHIEQITADHKIYGADSRWRLPPLIHDLEIDYTALSFVAPEKVLFRYTLEPRDRGWQDAGNRRQAYYTDLAPGRYRFRVMACNNSGVWNEQGDSLDFVIPPAWYQTMGFRALCIAAFMALLWAIYQLRVHQLREREKKFRETVETMPAIAFVADPNGNRTFFNRRWLEYTCMSLEQALGSGWMKAVHPDDLNRVLERWHASQKTGQSLDYELRLRRGSDGVYRWFQTRAEPQRDRRGKILKWCAVASDIEDRKQAERLQADLTHANRVSTMGELVASISHELAQPITVTTNHAKASLRWLKHDPPELAEVRQGTEKIVEASALASEIIGRLRSLYKKAPSKRELVAMNEVIADMAGMLRSEARGHGVSIRTDLKDDLPTTVADRVQLQQVLMNLMLNGIEAMNQTGGVLTVQSQLSNDGQILISVNDTGPGLPHHNADQLFEPFFTTKPQGSGMGLAICRSIVDSHGGRIWASENGGRGATFHFTVPAAAAT